MSVFLTPGRKAVLRGYLLPGRAASRDAVVPAGAGRHRRCVGRRDAQRSPLQGDHVAAAVAAPQAGRRRHRPIEADLADAAFAALERSFDPTWGGFGGAPKFPQPMVLEWLLRQHVRGRARTRSTWLGSRSTAWQKGASTTRSAGGSPGTAPTHAGTCRTSRRCCRTTHSSCRSTRMRGWSRMTTALARSRSAPPTTSCGRCSNPRAGSRPLRTRTARASKGSSSSGTGHR